ATCCVSFFFFQAEDVIRDFHVTGVQTCALPISGSAKVYRWESLPREEVRPGVTRTAFRGDNALMVMNWLEPGMEVRPHSHPFEQIGRASCRERGTSCVEVESREERKDELERVEN